MTLREHWRRWHVEYELSAVLLVWGGYACTTIVWPIGLLYVFLGIMTLHMPIQHWFLVKRHEREKR